MNIKQLIENLSENRHSFALYRLPGDKTFHLIAQNSVPAHTIYANELSTDKKGFVLHPFLVSDHHKAVIIQPEIQISFTDFSEKLPETYHLPVNIQTSGHYSPNTTVYNTDKSEFIKWCQDTLVKIKKGELEKAVLSAITVYKPATHLSPLCLFEKLSKAYPNVFVYFAHDMHTGCWLGATPELLLQYNDQQIKTVSLAGTRHDEGVLQQSMWSEKEIKEQELVTKHIIKCFQNYFSEPLHISETKTISTGHLLHLRTDFSMHFSDSYFNKSLSDFLQCLHPTPAVSGSPKTAAIQHISQTELHNREYYTGFIGPINLHEYSYLFVNLRCLKHGGNQLIIYTGAGITDGSIPEKEWEEVQLKAQTILKIL